MDLGRHVLGYKIIIVANRKVSTWVNSKSIGYRQTSAAGIQTRELQGGYARIYLKIIILKNYMHRARAALARALAPRAKVGGMSQL